MSDLHDPEQRAGPADADGWNLGLVDRRFGLRRARRMDTWAVAGVFALALGLLVGVLTRGRAFEIVDQPAGYEPSWTMLPDGPLDGRANAASVWTGNQLLVWGGFFIGPMGTRADLEEVGSTVDHETGEPMILGAVMFDDGALFDPQRGRWQKISPAPFKSGFNPHALWTGSEMIVVSASRSDGDLRVGAYQPSDDTWRMVDHPLGGGAAVETVWTGKEVLLWGAFDHQASRGDIGYAYHPTADRWRELPDAPVPARQGHTAVWTGSEMVVWGGTDLVGPIGENLGGGAYNPNSDTWRIISDAPIRFRNQHSAVWTGREMIVWGGTGVHAHADGAAYDPSTGRWRRLPDAPIAGRAYHAAVWDGTEMVLWGGSRVRQDEEFADGAAYLPESNRWVTLPASPLEGRCNTAAAPTAVGVVIWGGTVGCDVDGGTPVANGAILR